MGSGGFSSPFSAQRYIFFVFLSGLLGLIVLEFYFIFISLFCHTEYIISKIKKIINRLINIKFKISIQLGRTVTVE